MIPYEDIIKYHPINVVNVITDNKYANELIKFSLMYYKTEIPNEYSYWKKGISYESKISGDGIRGTKTSSLIKLGPDNCLYLNVSLLTNGSDNTITSFGWDNFLVKLRENKFNDLF